MQDWTASILFSKSARLLIVVFVLIRSSCMPYQIVERAVGGRSRGIDVANDT